MPTPLTYRLAAKELPNGTTRHIILRRSDHRPSRAGGLFESHLHRTKSSPNTIVNNLWAMARLLSWGDAVGVDVEERLLRGQPFRPLEIQGFSHWLMDQTKGARDQTTTDKRGHNQKIAATRTIERWFVEMYHQNADPSQRAIEIAMILEAQAGVWKRMARKTNDKPEASDLTDEEVAEIETYLGGVGVGPNADPIGARRYLMWRRCHHSVLVSA